MKIGLFFGTFNPIHVGHLIIANYMVESTGLDQVWLVVSPQNPFKQKSSLLDERNRLYMVNLAIEDNAKLRASDIEFYLSKPSYTIDTLTHLKEKYPQHEFVLIMGSDNLTTLHKWKNHELILANHEVFVYKRPGIPPSQFDDNEHIHFYEVPLLDISASFIRNAIQQGRSVKYMVPEKPLKYLEDMHFYEKEKPSTAKK